MEECSKSQIVTLNAGRGQNSDEMIPETHAHGYQKQATYALLLGFMTLVLVERFFEQHLPPIAAKREGTITIGRKRSRITVYEIPVSVLLNGIDSSSVYFVEPLAFIYVEGCYFFQNQQLRLCEVKHTLRRKGEGRTLFLVLCDAPSSQG